MTDETTYSARSAASRAAKRELGPQAQAGRDFSLQELPGDRWAWSRMSKAEPPKEKAPRAPAASAEPQEAAPRLSASAKAIASGPKREFPRMSGKHKKALEDAKAGKLPEPPDFSAETHSRFRPALAELAALVKKGDIEGLRAYPIKPVSTSPKALDRYRNLAITALEAKAGEPAL